MDTNELFGKEKISKVLLKIAPPVMLAQLIQALYNIVDSLFVGELLGFGTYGAVDNLPDTAADDRACGRHWGRY